ncbi:MAG: S-adenosylmethionine:tRNA ribosyltransferase-isomerase [Bacteroidales bacterium]
MLDPGKIEISNYNYDLPDERIAKYPLKERDSSKLLVYKEGKIRPSNFKHIVDFLPENSLLVYNETKVVQARIEFFKKTGARIEIFCLEPVEPTSEIQLAFDQRETCVWKCFVGNGKKWKEQFLTKTIQIFKQEVEIKISKLEKSGNAQLVKFEWDGIYTFAEILEAIGQIPLPPYLNREAEPEDLVRYQTVFAKNKGSVAAPTAGLHFTQNILNKLPLKNISSESLTLHVGAGTFKPVDCKQIQDHEMHTEQIVVELSSLKSIREKLGENIIPVGTTSMRTLESLYWHGVKLVLNPDMSNSVDVKQWDPYGDYAKANISPLQALDAIIDRCEKENHKYICGGTQLMIAPGYNYKIASGIITNFHQPKSTLLLLVSALIGENWKKIYKYALDNDFRFLSYGDSCLIFKTGQ